MKSLLIVGAGELGQVIAEIITNDGYDSIAFLDDNPTAEKQNMFPVVGKICDLEKISSSYTHSIIAIGNNQVRHELREKAERLGLHLITVIHPSAIISPTVKLGTGVIIRENVAISRNVVIEDGVLINMGVLIDHCCVIGEDSHLPMGAIVRNNKHIPALSAFTPGEIIQ